MALDASQNNDATDGQEQTTDREVMGRSKQLSTKDLFNDDITLADITEFSATCARFGSAQKSLINLGILEGSKNFMDFIISVHANSMANAFTRQDDYYAVTLKMHGRKTGGHVIAPEILIYKGDDSWYCQRKEEKKKSGLITFRTELTHKLDPLLKYLYTGCSTEDIARRDAVRELYSLSSVYADIEFKLLAKTVRDDPTDGGKKKKKQAGGDDDTAPIFDKGKFGGRGDV